MMDNIREGKGEAAMCGVVKQAAKLLTIEGAGGASHTFSEEEKVRAFLFLFCFLCALYFVLACNDSWICHLDGCAAHSHRSLSLSTSTIAWATILPSLLAYQWTLTAWTCSLLAEMVLSSGQYFNSISC